MNAFWYEGSYFMPPADHPDAETFLSGLSKGVPVSLRKLEAENAYPPFFAADKITPVTVAVDPESAFPMEATLLAAADIEARIATAERKCVFCHWKGGSAATGHRHCPALSLTDRCPLIDPGFDPGFLFYATAFWRRVEGVLPLFAKRVAKHSFHSAASLIERLLLSVPDVFVAAGERAGRPVLMLSGAGNDFLHLVAQYLVYIAPKTVTDAIDVLSSFPKGIFHRLEPGRRDRFEARPPQVACAPVRTDRPRFDLTVLVPEAAKDSAADDAFLYLAERLGEEALMGAMNSIRFIDDSGFDLDYHEKVVSLDDPGLVTFSAEQYARVVADAYAGEADRTGLESPFCFYEYYDLSESAAAGPFADIAIVDTCHMDLLEELLGDETGEALDDAFDAVCGIGSLAVDVAMETEGGKEKIRALDEFLNRFVHAAGGSVPFGIGLAERRTVFFFLLLDKRIARNAVRGLTPVLAAYRAIYRERWRNASLEAEVGFDLMPEEVEED
jgi:hypothetical protein